MIGELGDSSPASWMPWLIRRIVRPFIDSPISLATSAFTDSLTAKAIGAAIHILPPSTIQRLGRGFAD